MAIPQTIQDDLNKFTNLSNYSATMQASKKLQLLITASKGKDISEKLKNEFINFQNTKDESNELRNYLSLTFGSGNLDLNIASILNILPENIYLNDLYSNVANFDLKKLDDCKGIKFSNYDIIDNKIYDVFKNLKLKFDVISLNPLIGKNYGADEGGINEKGLWSQISNIKSLLNDKGTIIYVGKESDIQTYFQEFNYIKSFCFDEATTNNTSITLFLLNKVKEEEKAIFNYDCQGTLISSEKSNHIFSNFSLLKNRNSIDNLIIEIVKNRKILKIVNEKKINDF